jgi:hypothetical protein
MRDKTTVIITALQRLLRPLIRIVLRNGLACADFIAVVKQVYVEVASHDAHLSLPNKKQSDSRIAVLTGLSRKEVKAIKQNPLLTHDEPLHSHYNRAARVIHGWVSDRSFQDGWGEPALLPPEGEGASFANLIKKHSGDMPVRAILDELLRVGAIERLNDGRLKLLQRAYVPHTGELEKLHILGTDVGFLLHTIDHNLQQQPAYFQRKVAYDNLPAEILPTLQQMAASRGQQLLEEINAWLRQQDRDNNPKISGTGRKHAGVGIYFFEQNMAQDDD